MPPGLLRLVKVKYHVRLLNPYFDVASYKSMEVVNRFHKRNSIEYFDSKVHPSVFSASDILLSTE
jgi:hypothetical protein